MDWDERAEESAKSGYTNNISRAKQRDQKLKKHIIIFSYTLIFYILSQIYIAISLKQSKNQSHTIYLMNVA